MLNFDIKKTKVFVKSFCHWQHLNQYWLTGVCHLFNLPTMCYWLFLSYPLPRYYSRFIYFPPQTSSSSSALKRPQLSFLGIKQLLIIHLRPAADILNEISRLERSVRQIQTNQENITSIKERYEEVYNKYEIVTNLIQHLKDDVKSLTKAIEIRQRHYQQTEEFFITFIKHSFEKILALRQFEVMFLISIFIISFIVFV